MKKILLFVFVFIVVDLFAQEKFQLAAPMLKFGSAFFTGSTVFEVNFNQPGTELRYTLNGSEPTEKDLLYSGPVTIHKNTLVKVKAMGRDFRASETVSVSFVKQGKAIRAIEFSAPNEAYKSTKPDILYDNNGGFDNYRNGTWVGFDKDSAEIIVTLKEKEKISSILINMLTDENSWIFLPKEVRWYYMDKKRSDWLPAGKLEFQHDTPSLKKCNVYAMRPQHQIKTDRLRVIFKLLDKIPDWHPGKGNHGWLFIDEIVVL